MMKRKPTLIVAYMIVLFGVVRNEDPKKGSDMIGWTVTFSSMLDKGLISAHPNGDVETDMFLRIPNEMQMWTIEKHPSEKDALRFKQDATPLNTLSGKNSTFPSAYDIVAGTEIDKQPTWKIVIGGQRCITTNGIGYMLDVDKCQKETAKFQLWKITKI